MKNTVLLIALGLLGVILASSCQPSDPEADMMISKISKTEIQLASGKTIKFPEPNSGVSTMFIVKPGKHELGKDALAAELDADGFAYAEKLKTLLADVDIQSALAIATRFAQSTARPTADAHGTKVFTFNDVDFGAYLDYVYGIEKGGKFLVVEFDTKIPELLKTHTAGAETYDVIPDGVYDRLYVVISSQRGKAQVHELKF